MSHYEEMKAIRRGGFERSGNPPKLLTKSIFREGFLTLPDKAMPCPYCRARSQ
jgi:hypothetical protein